MYMISRHGLMHRTYWKQKKKEEKATHWRVVARCLGAAHASRGCSVEVLFYYQVNGRHLASLYASPRCEEQSHDVHSRLLGFCAL